MDRILIVKLGAIGDIVHTLPAVAALRKQYPQARLDWIVETRSKAILENCPAIDTLLEVDTRLWRRHPLAAATRQAVGRIIKQLRQTRYEVAIDFQGLFKSVILAKISGAARRIGFDRARLREPGARLFYTQTVSPSPSLHIIAQNNALVESLGVRVSQWEFPIAVAPEDQRYIEDQLRAHDCDRFVTINPGGGWITKLWPAERYGELSRRLYHEWGVRSVITAAADEMKLVDTIRRHAPSEAAIFFPTTIKQIIPLAKRTQLFIGGDTGPLHIAAAAGAPIVGLYGPTFPERNGPFRPADAVVRRAELPCLGCYKRTCPLGTTACMIDISVADVWAVMAALPSGPRATDPGPWTTDRV